MYIHNIHSIHTRTHAFIHTYASTNIYMLFIGYNGLSSWCLYLCLQCLVGLYYIILSSSPSNRNIQPCDVYLCLGVGNNCIPMSVNRNTLVLTIIIPSVLTKKMYDVINA